MNKEQSKEPSLVSLIKSEWYLLLIILATFVFGLYVYPLLPAQVPTHWNIQGQVDGWSSKTFAVIFFPLFNLGIYPLMLLLPKIDPRRENYINFSATYKIIRLLLHLFLAFIYIITLLAALKYPFKIDFFVRISVSLLFLLIGNYMGKFQQNYFIGIKTPWTLASEEVWKKTHLWAAPLWVIGGSFNIILSFFQEVWAGYLQIIIFILLALIPVIYSYFVYEKLNKEK